MTKLNDVHVQEAKPPLMDAACRAHLSEVEYECVTLAAVEYTEPFRARMKQIIGTQVTYEEFARFALQCAIETIAECEGAS